MSTRNVFLACSLATFLSAGAALAMSDMATAGDKSTPKATGSGSSGAGAGKITFNPFSITKKTDTSSPTLMTAPASKNTKSGNGGTSRSGVKDSHDRYAN